MSALSSIVNGSSPTKTKQPSVSLSSLAIAPAPAPAPVSAPVSAPIALAAPVATIATATDPSQNGKTSTPIITTTTPTATTATAATAVDVDAKYKHKYKDLKKRIRDIEDDNDVLNIKLSRARKNIHRLRVERSFLFDRLDQTEHPVNNATALTSSSSSSVSSSDLDSDADQNGSRSSRSHHQHSRHGLDRSRSRHSRYSSSALGSSSHHHTTTSNSLAVPGSSLSHSRPRTPPSRASSVLDSNSHSASAVDAASLSPSSGKKAIKKRRKDPLAPKRPSNAFFIFSQQHRQQAREEKNEGNQSELTKFLGQQWKSMPSTEKQIYSDLAIQDRQRYLNEMSHYQHENGINSATPSLKKKPGRPGRPPKGTRLEAADIPTRSNSETPTVNGHSIVDNSHSNSSSSINNNKMGIHSLVNDDVESMSSHEEDYTLMSFEDEHEQDEDDDDDEDDEEDVVEVEDRHHPGHGSMMDIKRNSLGEADVEMTEFHPTLPTVSVNGVLVNN